MTDITTITTQFETKTLLKEQWTHQAHLAVAFVYLDKYKSLQHTLPNIREGIKAYNVSVGTANTENSGYHETLTVFWITVVYEYYLLKNRNDINATYRAFIQSIFVNAEFPLKFYSKALLFSKAGRKTWIEPDLQPISKIKEMFMLSAEDK